MASEKFSPSLGGEEGFKDGTPRQRAVPIVLFVLIQVCRDGQLAPALLRGRGTPTALALRNDSLTADLAVHLGQGLGHGRLPRGSRRPGAA